MAVSDTHIILMYVRKIAILLLCSKNLLYIRHWSRKIFHVVYECYRSVVLNMGNAYPWGYMKIYYGVLKIKKKNVLINTE
jgi:hypothetical protein